MKLSSKSKTQSVGKLFEEQAKHFLIQQQLLFIEANSHCSFGEIDLIMLDNKTLCFIEVRFRGENAKQSALASINNKKQSKLHKSAQHWLLKHPKYKHHFCRFDCIGIEPKSHNEPAPSNFNLYHTISYQNKDYKLSWAKNAF